MGTTADKLQKIINTKAAIKEVANQHGAEITDDTPFSEYGGKLTNAFKIPNFWDTVQQNGKRKVYDYGLQYMSNDYFYPRYDIVPTSASWFARGSAFKNKFDLVARLNECGVKMDFSQATNVLYLFYSGGIGHLPVIDLSHNPAQANTLMFSAELETIDKFIVGDGSFPMGNQFVYASDLVNIVIEGTFGLFNLSLSRCSKLSLDSLKSFINALADYTGTDKEYKYTISLHPDSIALLEADGNSAPNGLTWLDYIDSKKWNV